MEEEDDGDEAEGGLMVHRGAKVIMHGKGAFPCDVCNYIASTPSLDFLYISMYVPKRGVWCFYNYHLCQSRHHDCVQSASTVRANSALQGVWGEPHFPGNVFFFFLRDNNCLKFRGY